MTEQDSWHPEAFLQNRWTNRYRALMENAQSQNRVRLPGEHAEHHIVPKSFYRSYCEDGWLDGDWDASENRVLLTHREHAQAHIWLWERMTEGRAHIKMATALRFLLNLPEGKQKIDRVSPKRLAKIMAAAALMNRDYTVRTWAHKSGRIFVGTRYDLEVDLGLTRGKLAKLTRPVDARLRYLGWWIVQPDSDPHVPPPPKQSGVKKGAINVSSRDQLVRDWMHADGRTFTGTRYDLEVWAGLPIGSLKKLTQIKPRRTQLGWWIVQPNMERPQMIMAKNGPKTKRAPIPKGRINSDMIILKAN